MAHTCHATGCKVHVPPEMFMCRRHWFMVPKDLRARIWASYRPGQCDDWQPSRVYCLTAMEAVRAVAAREGIEPDTSMYEAFMPDDPATKPMVAGQEKQNAETHQDVAQ